MSKKKKETEIVPEEQFPVSETTFITQSTPDEMKKECLKLVLENYTPEEILSLAATIEGGEKLPMSSVVEKLAAGDFSVSLETPQARDIHQNISADLLNSFIENVRMQGVPMDEEVATHYDILHDSWEMRTPKARKLQKIRTLIVRYGGGDTDLDAVFADLENLYGEDA